MPFMHPGRRRSASELWRAARQWSQGLRFTRPFLGRKVRRKSAVEARNEFIQDEAERNQMRAPKWR